MAYPTEVDAVDTAPTTGKVMLVNKANSSQATSGMAGLASQQTLTAYEVRFVDWTPS